MKSPNGQIMNIEKEEEFYANKTKSIFNKT